MSFTYLNRFLITRFSAASIYYSLLISIYFLPNLSPKLQQFEGNQIGEASLNAIDISSRSQGFYQFIFTFLISMLVLHSINSLDRLKIIPSLKRISESIAIIGIIQVVSAIFNPELKEFIFLPATFHLGFYIFNNLKQPPNLEQVTASIGFSLVAWLNMLWLLPNGLSLAIQLPIISLIFIFSSLVLVRMKTVIQRQVTLLKYLAFSSLLPLFITELHYFFLLKAQLNVSPYILYLILATILLIFALKKSKIQVSNACQEKQLLAAFILIACGFSIRNFYTPYGTASTELFEMANRAIPLMEAHFFRNIPLLEKASSHMVSDYGFGALYQFIFGYHGLDFLIFDVFDSLAYTILGFLIIFYLSNNVLASFYFICLFPFADASLPPYYAWCILPLIFLIKEFKNPSKINSWLFGISFTLLMPWRADLSFAVIIASVAIIMLGLLIKRIHSRFLIPLLISISILGSTLLIISVKNNIDWFHSLKTTIAYLISSQSYGLSNLGDTSSPTFVLQHYLIPLMVVTLILAFVVHAFKNKKSNNISGIIICYLGIFYLVNLPRGIVRHGFAEGFDNFLLSYSPFILSAGLALIIGLRAHKRWWLFIISLFVINLFLRFPSRLPEISQISNSTNSSLSANSLPSKLNKNRLSIDTAAISKVISLAHYLRNNLKEDETFIDFSNTPMLYFYAEKEVPSFFYQSPQNVHSIQLQKDWINRLENFKVPLIVMRHSPPEWWDATDGVPNEIRHYAFSDFLYQNYFPFNVTDGFEIWKKKTQSDTLLPAFAEDELYRYFDLKKLPSIWQEQKLLFKQIQFTQSKPSTWSLPSNEYVWLKLKIKSGDTANKKAQIKLIKWNSAFGGYEFDLIPNKEHYYMLRLTSSFAWWHIHPLNFNLELPENATISSIYIAKDFIVNEDE